MKIISIDPSANGVTAVIVLEYDYDELMFGREPITITNFANVDFRYDKSLSKEINEELRFRRLNTLLDFIEDNWPDVVICENFIMFRQQMGAHGQSFVTSEMIGVLEHHCRKLNIPIVKPRSSDVRGKIPGYYPSGQPKPKPFKPGLTNKDLIERGLLARRIHNSLHIVVNGVEYKLKDFQVGSKNDHVLMALKHAVNLLEYSRKPLQNRMEDIIHARDYIEEQNE